MNEQRQRAHDDARAKHAHVDLSVYRRLLAEHGPTDWRAYDALGTDSRVLRAPPATATPVPVSPRRATSSGSCSTAPRSTPSPAARSPTTGILTGTAAGPRSSTCSGRSRASSPTRCEILRGELRDGAELPAEVDAEWRLSACQAHSGTHVVHAALRQVLGPPALQSGSYNRPGYLRLDFAWQGALTQRQRSDIEDVANGAVRADLPVSAS